MARLSLAAVGLLCAFACGGGGASPVTPTPAALQTAVELASTLVPEHSLDPATPAPPAPMIEEVLVGAGDIAWCEPGGGAHLTAELLDSIPGTVFTTGDNAYMSGTLNDYRRCYEPTWGRHKARTRPSPGNHEHHDTGAEGYFRYFGPSAGPPGQGYYSYDLGDWHIVSLDSELSDGAMAAQVRWLRDDLSAHPTKCAAAYFHIPVFGSGSHGGHPHMLPAWRVLYEFGVDVVMSGHNHSYERFDLQNPDGRIDRARGIRQFVVGTGGAPLTRFKEIQPNSQAQIAAWGVLALSLRADSYDWRFVTVSQGTPDAGSEPCR